MFRTIATHGEDIRKIPAFLIGNEKQMFFCEHLQQKIIKNNLKSMKNGNS
uniref:Uncharacterized protein n=1 Tax=Arion vulgaris TaxID=1028688 RepID=A0A0B6Y233_9EUPU